MATPVTIPVCRGRVGKTNGLPGRAGVGTAEYGPCGFCRVGCLSGGLPFGLGGGLRRSYGLRFLSGGGVTRIGGGKLGSINGWVDVEVDGLDCGVGGGLGLDRSF